MRGVGSLDWRDSQGWESRAQTRDTCAQKGLRMAGPRHEGLALSPDAPQKTPQTIPSYLAKAHFFKVRRLQQQKGGTGSYGRRKRTSRGGVGGLTRVRACSWWRPGQLREAAASLTRRQAHGGPWVPADPLPHRSVHWPQAGPSTPREDDTSWEPWRGDSSPRLERAGAAPARPPAPRPDQWKHLNLKVPPYSPPHPPRALLPRTRTPGSRSGTYGAHTWTLERTIQTGSQHSERPRRGCGPLRS